MKKALICGASGFLAGHMERRLKDEGYYVVSVARKWPPFRPSVADETNILDLTNPPEFHHHLHRHHFDECYQFASDGGGLGYICNPDNDASVLTNSLKINLHTLDAIAQTQHVEKIFFASSQCVYPESMAVDPFAQERLAPPTYAFRERDASFNNFAFAQEKLFSEKLYEAYRRKYNIAVRIGRLGNSYGPYCTWQGDRAKAPAAICRKVAEAAQGGMIDVWGSGAQIRSFTYVDDTIEGIRRLMAEDYEQPVNIASSEAVTVAELCVAVGHVAGKKLTYKVTDGPVGVSARTSDNTLAKKVLSWEPSIPLCDGIGRLYEWVAQQVLTQPTP
jgi:GDP-D-mannose 3', 5'-epimerase